MAKYLNITYLFNPIKQQYSIMRKSLETFIETCFDIKCQLQLSSYEIHQYDDGSFSDFHVRKIANPKVLNQVIGSLEYQILSDDNGIVIRVYEDFREY